MRKPPPELRPLSFRPKVRNSYSIGSVVPKGESLNVYSLFPPFGGLFAFLVFAVCLISCRKDTSNPSWDVDVLAPLLKSTLTINNIIADSLLQQNPDNSLELVYKYSLSAFTIDSLFKIPDTTIHNLYPAPFTYSVSPGGSIIPGVSNPIYYPLGDAQLTHVTLRGGKMLLSIKSQIQGMVDFTYTMPKVTDSYGKFFDTTVTISAATPTSDGTYNGVFDLSGYKIDLTGAAGISVNTMITSYSAVLNSQNPNSVSINAGQTVDIANTFVDIVPQYAKGYFGHTLANIGPDSADFTMFNHIIDGTLNLEDIDIGLSIQNSIGVDARVTINEFTSINTGKGTSVPLFNSIIGSPLNINRSSDNSGMVTPATYSVSFTPSNSNIKPFMENLPDRLSYQLDLEINPLGNVSGGNDFVYYDKLMKTEMNMTIPLSLVANDLTMADTLDLNRAASIDNVNSGYLYLYAENGFPFTAEAQLYLMDVDLNLVDSLLSAPNSILAPPLDANNICAGKKLSILSFPMDAQKLALLRETRKMYIKLKFNTAGQPNYVKLYSFYEMNVKLVGDFNYTFGR
ncbi:MAG: hypothetical protein EPN85_07585 [Bacteroidetes bacterium]|nr:MAG: hypothetical protein EPN85_07585 [Bacteroidota bacterium]